MSRPIDVATGATAAFLAANVPRGSRVLEVGCGEGHVALALRDLGYRVVGLESEAETVARAQRQGAPVVQAHWPAYDGEPADAIAFTRSLHHIGSLPHALDKARQVVAPDGLLLVEDFAFDEIDEATLAWFARVLHDLPAAEARSPRSDFLSALAGSREALAVWRQHHAHEVHTMAAMQQRIEERFTITFTDSVPYLYRYLVPALSATAAAAAFVQEVLRREVRDAKRGDIVLVGRRVVGRARAIPGPCRP